MDRESGGSVDPNRSYSVEVSGVGGPRNRSGLLAAAVLVVVVSLVMGGLVSGQLFPVEPAAVAPSSSPASSLAAASPSAMASPSGVSSPPPGPVPSGPLTARITSSAVDVVALVASIPAHGTGPIAFVSGRLHTHPKACDVGSPLSACLGISIDGLRGAGVVPDDTMQGWPGDPVMGDTLVLLPKDGKLVYLGSLAVNGAGIPRADVLAAQFAAAPAVSRPRQSLHEADGILVNGGASCLSGLNCPAGGPTVIALPPVDGGPVDPTAGLPVTIVPGAFGIDETSVWTTGPFLVRATVTGSAIIWLVVAREDQGSILHVVIP